MFKHLPKMAEVWETNENDSDISTHVKILDSSPVKTPNPIWRFLSRKFSNKDKGPSKWIQDYFLLSSQTAWHRQFFFIKGKWNYPAWHVSNRWNSEWDWNKYFKIDLKHKFHISRRCNVQISLLTDRRDFEKILLYSFHSSSVHLRGRDNNFYFFYFLRT